MANEQMEFPKTWEEYEKDYGFNDSEEVYTNNARLIPSFRVKQWLDHLPSIQPKPKKGRWLDWAWDEDKHRYVGWLCSNCKRIKSDIGTKTDYCPACGIEMVNSQWGGSEE